MVTYLINGRKETFENEAQAQAYIKALGPGNDVELITEGPPSDDKKPDDWENDGFATGEDENKVFPTDAAESADVVSETPAQDTELTSEDGSSGSQTEDDYVKKLLKSPFHTKTKPEDFAAVEDYVTHEQQVKDIANNVQSESLEAVNSALPKLKRTEFGSFDYTNVDIEEVSIQATRNFIKNDDFINNELTPQIKEKLKPLTDNKIEEVRAKYKFDNPENATEENIAKAEAELNAWYSEQFNNEMSEDPAFKKRIEAFDLNKDVILGEDIKRFRSVNNEGNTVNILGFDTGIDAQRATDRAALWMLDLSKTDMRGSSMAKIALELFNVGRQIETSMSKAGTVGKLQMDMEKQNSFKRNQELAEKNNWTGETKGYWSVPNKDNTNANSTYKFTPKYVRDLGYADQEGTTSKSGVNVIEGTWAEYQKAVAEVTQKDIQQFGKRISELSEEELKESLVETKSWDRIKDGEGGLDDLLAVGLAQGSQVALAATPLGFMSSASQIGADIYYTKIEEEAKRRNNIENAEDLTPEMYAEVAADVEFTNKAINVALSGGALAGALDKFGAGKTMKLFNNVSAKAILRGGAKDYFKRVANFSVENTKAGFIEAGTETLQEVVQAFASGTEVTAEQLFDAGGQAFISNLVFGGGGKAIQTTTKELTTAYSILSGKFNKNSSEAFFNQQLSDIDLAISKTKDKYEVETLQEKRKIIQEYKDANASIPKNVTAENRKKLVDNLVEERQIKDAIKEAGDILGPAIMEDQKPKLEALKIDNARILAEAKVAAVAKGIGSLNIQTASTQAEVDDIIEKMQADRQAKGEKPAQVNRTSYGFFYTSTDGKKNVVLNTTEIVKDGTVNTAAHEILHHAIDTLFKNSENKPAEMMKLSEELHKYTKSLSKSFDNKELQSRFDTYNAKMEAQADMLEAAGDTAGAINERTKLAEEGLTLLSEAMLNGDIKFDESVVAKAKNLIRRLLSFAGVKAKIETGEDVFNFIKDYNRSIQKGKLSKGLKNTFAEGARGKGITKTNKRKPKVSGEVKESSKKMDNLVAQQEALTSMEGIMDAAELDIMKQENQQKIDELKAKEGIQPKTSANKKKGPMTLEEADEAYEDALEAWNETPDNDALEAEVEKALKEVAAAKARFDEGMEAPVEVKAEDKSTAKPVREKKDRSTKRYTLTDEAKAKVEPLIEEAQAMNKELRAEEKRLNDERIAKIRATPESEMSRTEQANAVLQAKANPIRLDKPVRLQRLETEIQDRLEKPLGKAVTFFTKLFYDKIPKEAANVIGGRDVYKSAAEARLINIVINEFKKNTVNRAGEKTINDVEDIIFNRGGLRLLTLATDLGVVDSKQGIAGAIDEGKVGDYGDWDKAFDDSPVKMDVDGMFRVSSLLGDSGRMAQAMEQVAEFWKNNIGNSPIENFKKLPSLVDNIVADMLNISENVLTARSGNLNKDDYTNALKGITKPYAVFKVEGKEVRVAPEFALEFENRLQNEGKSFERFADQNILQTLFKFLPKLSADDYRYADRTKGRYSGKATGVPKNLVKLTYSGLERGTTGMGNMKARVSKVAYNDVLAALGGFVNPDGGVSKLANVSGRTPEGQTLLGVIKLMNRMITNDISRNSNMGLDPMTAQDIAAGKNDLMMSLKSKRNAKPIQVKDKQLQAVIDLFSGKNPKATYIQQIDNIHGVLKNMDSTISGIFNYEVREYIRKNDPDSLADVSKAYDKSWGKTFKYVQEYISFKSAIDEISVNPSKDQLENFFVLYARALKNKQYEGAKNNTLLFDLVGKAVGPKVLSDLGFRLRTTDNMSFIEVKGENGKYETISSPLNIDTIKKLAKGEKLDPAKIKEIGDTMFDDAVRYTELMINHIDRLVNSNQKSRAIADIHTMGQGQLTPIRKLSNLGTVYKFDGDGILEHAESVALIQEKLVSYAEGKINEAQLREYLGNQKVNIIPKEADPSQRVGTEEQKYSEAKVKKILGGLESETYDAAARRTELENKAKAENSDQAFNKAMDRTADTERKGISVLDFDDTLARTKSNVLYTMPNGKTGKLTAEQFAKDGDRMVAEGAEWDFSEFSQVIDGKKGPLFEKTKDLVSKFGNENVFILTARPANSKYAIHEFLSGLGLDIPLQNITGLADSNPQAKADWITGKAAEGYNDFFFADDHIKNVTSVNKAIKKAKVKGKTVVADPNIMYSLKSEGQPQMIKDLLDVFDMDGEGQTLLDKATRTLDLQWNMLYKDVTGVDADIEFNEVEAQKLGDEVSKGFKARFKSIMRGYLVESGADDFLGLLYRTLPKGKRGEAMMKLYEENLLKPFAIASREIEKARIKMAKRYRDIKVNNGISDKVLNGKVTLKTESGKDITYTSEDAVRVYMWRKQGIKVPGLSEQNELDLAEHVKQSDELYRFTLNLMAKTLPEEFADPSKNWVTGSLKTDYLEGINKAKRKEALRFWSKGIETIFSESNMNKLRVQHGTKYVAALQNSIERMKTGRNSTQSLDSDTKVMLQFISGAVGNIMFLNTRSAGLQLLSATNFMAAGDNTWGKSLKTMFTKLPTLAKDYKMLMNTDFLLDRRNALKMDVNDSDIARIAEGKGLQGKLARFLQWGYVFTQAADSRAIALGGAVYYRNAYDKLIKQGVDPKAAKEQALLETTEHAQNSQQSSRADKISKQQASTSGRLMLAFANTPMQYNRLVQKSYLDLVNGRGSKGKNLYNIAYYGLAQNLLFTVAQGAMLTSVYGTLFGDDEEEDKLDYNQKVGIANGVLSSWLRGMGIWGNGLNALKQTFMNIHKESKKKRPEYDVAAIKGLTSIMPAVGSKISKIYATTRAIDYNKDMLFDVNEGSVFKNYAKMPGVVALGQTAALFNIPLDRAQRKIANMIDAVNYAQSDLTKTAGLLFGHSLWTLQSDAEKEADYEEQKARRKVIKKDIKETEAKKDLTPAEIRRYDLKKLKKAEQVDILEKLGRSTRQINKLKKEADRIEAIIEYQNLEKRRNSLK
jgi:hypothetical protein